MYTLCTCSNNESVVQEVRALEEQAFTLPKFILKKVQELMREIIGGLISNTECACDDGVNIVTSYLRIVTSYLRLVTSYLRIVTSYLRIVTSYLRIVTSYLRIVTVQ